MVCFVSSVYSSLVRSESSILGFLVYTAFAKLQRIARASTINAMLSLYRTSRAFSDTHTKVLDRHFLLTLSRLF